jgi:hypothetical protein
LVDDTQFCLDFALWLRNQRDRVVLLQAMTVVSRPGRAHRFQRLAPAALALGLVCLAAVPAATGAATPAAVTASAAATGGDASTPTSTSPALVTATLEQCLTASDQTQRSATFYGQIETIPGAARMAIQIDVQEHAPGDSAFHTLAAPGLDVWQHSETGVKIYKDVRQVTDLSAPALYRALVQFRWLDEKGHVIKSTTRRTETCRQPSPHSAAGTPTTTTGTNATTGTSTADGANTDTAMTPTPVA